MTKVHDEVLAANATYAKTFGDKAKLAMPPARRFAILTCMDARLDPAKFAGLAEGDAHVVRNAGGRGPATTPSARWSSRTSCSAPTNGS
jgi:carbonic anhydrase